MKVKLQRVGTALGEDPLKRRLDILYFPCPCGQGACIYVTTGPAGTIQSGIGRIINVWHYDIVNGKLTLKGDGANSVNLYAGDPVYHRPECHLTIADADVEIVNP